MTGTKKNVQISEKNGLVPPLETVCRMQTLLLLFCVKFMIASARLLLSTLTFLSECSMAS